MQTFVSIDILRGAYFSPLAWVMHAFTPPLNLMCDHSQNLLNLSEVAKIENILNREKTRAGFKARKGLKQKPLIPNSGGTLRLEQQETTEQLKQGSFKTTNGTE